MTKRVVILSWRWSCFTQLAKFFPDHRVQSAERLVQQENTGFDRKCARQGNSLALPAGQLRGQTVFESGQLNETEEFKYALSNLGGRRPALSVGDFQTERDILVNRHVTKQRIILKDETDPPLLNSQPGGILIIE